MRKLSKILVLVLAFAMLFAMASMFTASAALKSTDSMVVAGSSDLCHGDNWAASSAKNKMTWDADNERFYKEYTNVPAGTYEFKCVKGGSTWIPSGSGNNHKVTVAKTGSTVIIYITADEKISSEVIDPSCPNHNPQMTSTTATCTSAGKETWLCAECGEGYTKDVYAYGHYYTADGQCVRGDATTEFVRVYVQDAANWGTVYCYTWAADGGWYVGYPGEKMEKNEDGLYYYDIPKNCVNVIFCNGSDAKKTSNMKVPTDGKTVYNNSSKGWSVPHVHSWSDATCTTPATCSCGKTQGGVNPDAHNYENDMLCECGKAKFPTAKVTPILNEKLSFALNFTFDGLENWTEEYIEALLAQYGNWLVDFRLTISGLTAESVRFNADDETADGYLGGQYDDWSENWVYVPFTDATIADDGSLLIMNYAAGNLDEPGLRYTLAEVAAIVVDFDCGMYFTPAFFEANPDVQVKLELVVVPVDENGVQGEEESLTTNVFGKDDAHVHEYGEGSVTLAPTCLTNGTYTQTCACGKVVETEIPASADYHYYVLDICYFCYNVRPSVVLGNNTIVVPESGSAFGMIYIEEAGKYNITANGALTSCIFKDSIFATGSDFSITYDADYNQVLGASWYNFVETPKFVELEAGYYYVGVYGAGEYTVTVNKYIDPATCEHVYFYTNCTRCGIANPFFKANLMVVGKNQVICNEYHLVDTTGHGNPYQFTTFTVTEAGHYKFTSNKDVGLTLFTTEITAPDADFTPNTGASWGQFIAGNEIDLQPGTYYIGIIFTEGEGEYEITLEKVEPAQEEELGFFAQIWAKIVAFFASIVEFFKGIFVKG